MNRLTFPPLFRPIFLVVLSEKALTSLPFCARGCGACCRSSGVPGNAAAAVVTVEGFRGKLPGRKMEPPFTVTPFNPGKVMVDVTAGVTVVTCTETYHLDHIQV